MAYPTFTCALEKDHNPAISKQAEQYFQQARAIEKAGYKINWVQVERNYQQAIELNNWKAMHNLAAIYRKGVDGVPKDHSKMLSLYAKMVQLKVPLGYYDWAVAVERGQVPDANKGDAASFMQRAAELGSPLAQVRIGNYYAFDLPRGQQRYDLAEKYFRCAGKQEDAQALIEVADFFKIAKENKPLALFYNQKAASLGNMDAVTTLELAFEGIDSEKFGYKPAPTLNKLYHEMYYQLRKNPDLKFPNLMKDHPLPRHPTQGYDADNPDVRPQ